MENKDRLQLATDTQVVDAYLKQLDEIRKQYLEGAINQYELTVAIESKTDELYRTLFTIS